MAANSLTTTYSDLRVEVGRELGWGRSYSDWTSENKSDFGYIAKEGYRQFLYPDPLPNENKSHNWSFLYPLGTLALEAWTYTATTEIMVFSIVGSTFSMAPFTDPGAAFAFPITAEGAEVVITDSAGDVNKGVITSRNSDTSVSGYLTSGTSDITHSDWYLNLRSYDLPDDFGGMVSDGFTYRRDEQWHLPDIRIVGEGEIRKVDRETTGDIYPKVAALTPLIPVTGTGTSAKSSRWAVRFYPDRGDTDYELEYRYHSIPPALDADTNIYHYGGAEHSSTIIASMVDVGYQKIRYSYEKHNAFLARLRQSVLHDRRNYLPNWIGQGSKSRGDYSDRDALRDFRSSISTSNISTTFS